MISIQRKSPEEPEKQIMQELGKESPGGEVGSIGQKNRVLAKLHYVITESKKGWQDQILELAKLVIDGFQKSVVRKIARDLKCENPQGSPQLSG